MPSTLIGHQSKIYEKHMNFIRKLFKRKVEPPFDIEKVVREYLLKLPQCSKDVVIVSPTYGEECYSCEIIVATKDLYPWAEHHANSVWCSDREEQAARKTLPLWLQAANVDDDSKSYIPHFMYRALRPYVLNFVKNETAKIFCPTCQSFVGDIEMQKLDETRAAGWSWWTDVWACPNGHQLYFEKHEMYVHRSH